MLASETNTSRTLLFQKIKAITGETENDFIVSMRIKKAADLLTHSSLGIAEIAYNVGFNNPKYFAKCFKEIFDKTPSQYRNL